METRPTIKLTLSPRDKFVEWASRVVLAAVWILVSVNYTSLPDTIPTHYNLAGTPDAYGYKGIIWTLPLLGSLLLGILSILNQHPESFNYYGEVTPHNAARQYAAATRTLRYIQLAVVTMFGAIAYQTILIAKGQHIGAWGWAMSAIAIAIVARIGWHIYTSSQLQKTDS